MFTDITDLTDDERAGLSDFAKRHTCDVDSKNLLTKIKSSIEKRRAQKKRRRNHLRTVAFPNAYKLFLLAIADGRVHQKIRDTAEQRLRLTINTPLATIIAKFALASDRRHAAFYGSALMEAARQRINPDRIGKLLNQKELSITGLARSPHVKRADRTEKTPQLPRLSWSGDAREKFEKRCGEVGRLVLLVELNDGKPTVKRATANGEKAWKFLQQLG